MSTNSTIGEGELPWHFLIFTAIQATGHTAAFRRENSIEKNSLKSSVSRVCERLVQAYANNSMPIGSGRSQSLPFSF